MRWNIVCGGPAGQGPNFLAGLISQGLAQKGYYLFCSREYQSMVRGGHNYNTITFSTEKVMSNTSGIDILIPLDKLSRKIHEKNTHKKTIIYQEGEENSFYIGAIFKLLNLGFDSLENNLKGVRNAEEALKEAKKGYDSEKRKIELPLIKKRKNILLMDGSEAIALSAIKSGLDFYYAYPMTPATGLLVELAKRQKDNSHYVVGLENEIADIAAATGSAITGAKVMVGTSGGGFDLMTEFLSFIGASGIPVVFYLAQRFGPGTGFPTGTGQGDLDVACCSGHGEFTRIVVAPGDPTEAMERVSELFYLTQKYKVPGIILSDKHLAESVYLETQKPRLKKSIKNISWPKRFSSYETDIKGEISEKAEDLFKAAERRKLKREKILQELEKLNSLEVFGNTQSKNLVLTWGSTKGPVLDATKELNCKMIHVPYLEPLPKKLEKEIKSAKKVIVVENNSDSPFSKLISKNFGYVIPEKNKILKYDGRQFFSDVIKNEIKKRIK
ncbi:2-oxoacid:acceptor oxidoreductase family protein [Patescibacteria group bacterium]|nr:2-oxoacid:acceptor oxidoreductase family protein [Patescibacteria group bacterium]